MHDMTIKSNLGINQEKPHLNSSFGVHYAIKGNEDMNLKEGKWSTGEGCMEGKEGRNNVILL